MSKNNIDNIRIEELERFVVLWNSVKEAANLELIDEFKLRRSHFRDFIILFPELKDKRIEEIKDLIRERKLKEILE